MARRPTAAGHAAPAAPAVPCAALKTRRMRVAAVAPSLPSQITEARTRGTTAGAATAVACEAGTEYCAWYPSSFGLSLFIAASPDLQDAAAALAGLPAGTRQRQGMKSATAGACGLASSRKHHTCWERTLRCAVLRLAHLAWVFLVCSLGCGLTVVVELETVIRPFFVVLS